MILLSSCGDALSSLEGVEHAQHEHYSMRIIPDFARRGDIQTFTMTLEQDLIRRLSGQAIYPSEIRFGKGTSLRSFTMESQNAITAQVLISPLAEEGKREPILLFSTGHEEIEVTGTFWILPALSK